MAIEVKGVSRSVADTLALQLSSGLKQRGYEIAPSAAAARWKLLVDIGFFDTTALQSDRRIYVEMSVRGIDKTGRELFHLDYARATHPLAGTANAKRRAHLIELGDIICYAIPILRPAR